MANANAQLEAAVAKWGGPEAGAWVRAAVAGADDVAPFDSLTGSQAAAIEAGLSDPAVPLPWLCSCCPCLAGESSECPACDLVNERAGILAESLGFPAF